MDWLCRGGGRKAGGWNEGQLGLGAFLVVSTVVATVFVVVSSTTAMVVATQEEIGPKPGDDGLPNGTAEPALSELASLPAPKAD